MKKLSKLFSIFFAIVILSSTFVCVNVDAKMSLHNQTTMDGSWSQSYTLENYNDEHTYDVSFTTDGLWNCVVESTDYVSWELRDLSGQRIKSEYLSGGSVINPVTEAIDTIISKGSYKLIITGEGSYKFKNTFTGYNVNDYNAISMNSPQEYTMGTIMSGAITINDAEDWFIFNVPSNGNYTITFMTYMNSMSWSLYNSSLSEVESDYVYGGTTDVPKEQKVQCTLPMGTYYLKATSSYQGVYVFAVEALTSASCTHTYDYKYVSPTYFKKGYTLKTCTMCGEQVKESIKAKYQIWASTSLWRYGSKASYSWGSATGAKGYQLQYAKKKNFKGGKKKIIKGKNNTSTYIYGIRKGMKLYIRVRPYKKSGGKKVFGRWSKTVIFKKIK